MLLILLALFKVSRATAIATPQNIARNDSCSSQAYEGKIIMKPSNVNCQQKVIEKINNATAIANQEAQKTFAQALNNVISTGNCVTPAVQGVDKCILKEIVNNAYKQPNYEVTTNGNTVILSRKHTPIALEVITTKKVIARKIQLKKPGADFIKNADSKVVFNDLGQILKAEGQFPVPGQNDPCKPCKEPKTVEGISSICKMGCQTTGTAAFINNVVVDTTPVESKPEGNKHGNN